MTKSPQLGFENSPPSDFSRALELYENCAERYLARVQNILSLEGKSDAKALTHNYYELWDAFHDVQRAFPKHLVATWELISHDVEVVGDQLRKQSEEVNNARSALAQCVEAKRAELSGEISIRTKSHLSVTLADASISKLIDYMKLLNLAEVRLIERILWLTGLIKLNLAGLSLPPSLRRLRFHFWGLRALWLVGLFWFGHRARRRISRPRVRIPRSRYCLVFCRAKVVASK
jgi:hypothetical protein